MSPEEALRATLARVRELSACGGKHQQIRVHHWVRTLLAQPTSNATWLRNVLAYASALLQMLVDGGTLREPFDRLPPQGPLPTLRRHASARASARASRLSGTDAPLEDQRSPARGGNQSDAMTPPKRERRVQSQQVQTSESEEQWEWQRVWKVAFEHMRCDLDERTRQTRALKLEVKELRAVRSGLERALEREQQATAELQLHHDAELVNLRAVHDLELQALKAQHRKKIQETTIQNERELQRRRRDMQLRGNGNGNDESAVRADAVDDFLAYIDAFHLETLVLTSMQ